MPQGSAANAAAGSSRGVLRRLTSRLTGIDVDTVENLIVAIRVLFYRFSLINITVLVPLTLGSAAPPAWKAISVAASLVLALRWRGGYQRASFPLWSPLIEGVALALISATIGDPLRALSMYYVGLYFRTLYGTGRNATALAVSYLAAHFASVALASQLGVAGGAELWASTVLMQIPGFATTVIAMNSLLVVATRIEEDRRRQVLLAGAGARLSSAEQPQGIAAIAVEVAGALTGQGDVAVALTGRDGTRVEAATAPVLVGRTVDLHTGGLATLLSYIASQPAPRHGAAGRNAPPAAATTVTLPADDVRALGLPWTRATVVGLPIRGGQVGALMLERCSRSLHGALASLAWQVALALGRAQAAAEVHAREARFRSLLANASDVIGVLDRDGTILYQSEGLTRLMGAQPDDVAGSDALRFVHADDLDGVHDALMAVLAEPGRPRTVECRLRHTDGGWRHVEAVVRNLLGDPAVEGIVVNYRDVTERKELEARLRYQALHDALTGLANRDLFYDRVAHALEQRRRAGGLVGLLFVDLDNFKRINDEHGHAAGDEVLTAVADRLRTAMRDADTCARLGGDEFGVLLEHLSRVEDADDAGRRVLEALSRPVSFDDRSMTVEASAGIVIADGAETVDELIRDADLAMYDAKGAGKGRFQIFNATMHATMRHRLALRDDVERGIAAGEFVAHYQPIVALASLTVVGVEAVVRWRHPDRGLLAPEAFATLADESALLMPISRAVLQQACQDARDWRDEHGHPLSLHLNVPTSALRDPDLAARIVATAAAAGIGLDRLSLEITAPGLATIGGRETLHELVSRGARMVLDDFGAGGTALACLEEHPIAMLKLDRSLIDRLDDGDGSRMTGAVVALARTFAIDAAATGVERHTQVERLRALGCRYAQGSWFCPPVAASEVPGLLQPGGMLVGHAATEV